jgi:CheY-like chemotaxis protein
MAKVLLVEDDPANARVFEKVLQRRGGFEVLHSQDVEQILQLAQAREVDVILLDVSLAQSTFRGEAVDGIRIAQLLKGGSPHQLHSYPLGNGPRHAGRPGDFFGPEWGRWLHCQASRGSRGDGEPSAPVLAQAQQG